MVLESYSLGEMRLRMKDEFGIDNTDVSQDSILDDKINEAVSAVIRKRPNWPWQRKTLILDVSPATQHTATTTTGLSDVYAISPSVSVRDVLISGSSNNSVDYYTVTETGLDLNDNGSNNDIRIDRQWMEGSGTSTLTRSAGYIQLPEDFLRLDVAAPVEDLAIRQRFDFLNITAFEKIRRKDLNSNFQHWYTIQTDPINLDSRHYMAIYPSLDERATIRGSYFMDPPVLQNDQDEPILARGDRPTVMYKAMHLYARALNDERQNSYFAEFAQELAAMLRRYELSDDVQPTSATRFHLDPVDGTNHPSQPDYIP